MHVSYYNNNFVSSVSAFLIAFHHIIIAVCKVGLYACMHAVKWS